MRLPVRMLLHLVKMCNFFGVLYRLNVIKLSYLGKFVGGFCPQEVDDDALNFISNNVGGFFISWPWKKKNFIPEKTLLVLTK